jgi:hypothetical protein
VFLFCNESLKKLTEGSVFVGSRDAGCCAVGEYRVYDSLLVRCGGCCAAYENMYNQPFYNVCFNKCVSMYCEYKLQLSFIYDKN